MPINFRLEKDEGLLDWTSRGEGAVELTQEEASIVAQAETAAALRGIAIAIRQVGETLDDRLREMKSD